MIYAIIRDATTKARFPDAPAFTPMNWMQRHDFWAWQAQDQFMLDETVWCCFRISQADLQARIGDMPPNDDLHGEDDPPGPVLRWYGQLHGIPLLLDWHAFMPGGGAVIVHGQAQHARGRVRPLWPLGRTLGRIRHLKLIWSTPPYSRTP